MCVQVPPQHHILSLSRSNSSANFACFDDSLRQRWNAITAAFDFLVNFLRSPSFLCSGGNSMSSSNSPEVSTACFSRYDLRLASWISCSSCLKCLSRTLRMALARLGISSLVPRLEGGLTGSKVFSSSISSVLSSLGNSPSFSWNTF